MEMRASNRWGGFSALREKWSQHLASAMIRPVLLIDEAQLMSVSTLTELRLLSSDRYDSRKLITLILAGNMNLSNKLRTKELEDLESRVRIRFEFSHLPQDDLKAMLLHVLKEAGHPELMTTELINTLTEQCCGSPRIMMQMADDLLIIGAQLGGNILDQSIYYDVFQERLGKPRSNKGGEQK